MSIPLEVSPVTEVITGNWRNSGRNNPRRARAVLCHAKTKTAPAPDRLRAWALHLERFRGHNKAAVALANKLARIAWAVWKYDTDFAAAPAA